VHHAFGRDDRAEIKMQTSDGVGNVDLHVDPPSPFGKLYIPGLRCQRITSKVDADRALQVVDRNRHFASTLSNQASSRSHYVLSLNIFTLDRAECDHPCAHTGALHIIDLAGSERTKRSQAAGQQLKEATSINRSLSALADVISALGDSDRAGRSHVPYRNSKLTYLLQDVLGGQGCKSLMFAQISSDADDTQETRSTLTFATQVAGVEKGRLRPQMLTERTATPIRGKSASTARDRSSSKARHKRMH